MEINPMEVYARFDTLTDKQKISMANCLLGWMFQSGLYGPEVESGQRFTLEMIRIYERETELDK